MNHIIKIVIITVRLMILLIGMTPHHYINVAVKPHLNHKGVRLHHNPLKLNALRVRINNMRRLLNNDKWCLYKVQGMRLITKGTRCLPILNMGRNLLLHILMQDKKLLRNNNDNNHKLDKVTKTPVATQVMMIMGQTTAMVPMALMVHHHHHLRLTVKIIGTTDGMMKSYMGSSSSKCLCGRE
jgi:hypothetical protein